MKKTILITGASSGIGKASAIYFQEKGWNVIASMRKPADGTDLASKENVLVSRLDVLDLASIDKTIEDGINTFGKIDVVLNNAGYAVAGAFEAVPRENMQRQFAVNVQGLFDVTQKVLPHFRQNKDGMYINVSSVGGKITFPVMSLYHSTKFAVEGFSESLHYELAAVGIRVKIVEPGGVATDFGTRSLDLHHNPELTEYNEIMMKLQAVFGKIAEEGQFSTPEYIAEIIYNAATDGTDTLRYIAGKDAEETFAARASMNDEQFFAMTRERFQL